MNRLTKNVGNDYTYKNRYNQAYHKLGKLEDIEEELGCPLEVMFKALKNGIYYEHSYYSGDKIIEEIKFEIQPELYLTNAFNDYALNVYTDYSKALKDYKKTWWLKEDRSE